MERGVGILTSDLIKKKVDEVLKIALTKELKPIMVEMVVRGY